MLQKYRSMHSKIFASLTCLIIFRIVMQNTHYHKLISLKYEPIVCAFSLMREYFSIKQECTCKYLSESSDGSSTVKPLGRSVPDERQNKNVILRTGVSSFNIHHNTCTGTCISSYQFSFIIYLILSIVKSDQYELCNHSIIVKDESRDQ